MTPLQANMRATLEFRLHAGAGHLRGYDQAQTTAFFDSLVQRIMRGGGREPSPPVEAPSEEAEAGGEGPARGCAAAEGDSPSEVGGREGAFGEVGEFDEEDDEEDEDDFDDVDEED